MDGFSEQRQHGFNYGAGWGQSPKPKLYDEASVLADRLRKESAQASARSWALDHALWKVRIAETQSEKLLAFASLYQAMSIATQD